MLNKIGAAIVGFVLDFVWAKLAEGVKAAFDWYKARQKKKAEQSAIKAANETLNAVRSDPSKTALEEAKANEDAINS